MKKQTNVDIRYTRPMDVSYLREWLQTPLVMEHFPMSDAQEVATASDCWLSYCRYQSSLTATDNQVPCGIATLFLCPYQKIRHHCSFRICVDPNRWREGIGESLIKNIRHLAKEYFHLEEVHLEIYGEQSPILFLLQKFGFQEFARQEHYLKTPNGYLPRICMLSNLLEEG